MEHWKYSLTLKAFLASPYLMLNELVLDEDAIQLFIENNSVKTIITQEYYFELYQKAKLFDGMLNKDKNK